MGSQVTLHSIYLDKKVQMNVKTRCCLFVEAVFSFLSSACEPHFAKNGGLAPIPWLGEAVKAKQSGGGTLPGPLFLS